MLYYWITNKDQISSWSMIQIGNTLLAPLPRYDSNGNIFRRQQFQNYDPDLYGCSSVGPSSNNTEQKDPDRICVCDRRSRRKVFILGLPKAGTQSLHHMFRALGCHSVHWWNSLIMNGHPHSDRAAISESEIEHFGYLGVAMDYAHRHNQSLLHYIPSRFTVFAQMDIVEKEPGYNIWPQMVWYQLLYEQYPDALFILNYRDLDQHIRSINKWNDLRARLIWNEIPGLPRGRGWRDSELKEWMLTHYCAVERFFMDNAPRSFLKFDIERDSISKLEHFLQCDNITMPHTHDTHQRCKNSWRC